MQQSANGVNLEVQRRLQGSIAVDCGSAEEPRSVQMISQVRLIVLVVGLDEVAGSPDDRGIDYLDTSNSGGRVGGRGSLALRGSSGGAGENQARGNAGELHCEMLMMRRMMGVTGDEEGNNGRY